MSDSVKAELVQSDLVKKENRFARSGDFAEQTQALEKQNKRLISAGKTQTQRLVSELDRQNQELIAAGNAQALSIVAAQEHTWEMLEDLQTGLSDISVGIQNLTTAIHFAFQDVARRLDRQSAILEQAVLALESPQTTLANEARRMGIERFQNAWFEEAADEFKRCLEANSTDFLAYIFLANIALIDQDVPLALEHGQKAAKYAAPYSDEWTSFAWTQVAQAHLLIGNADAAEQAARRAVLNDHSSATAHYACARAYAMLGATDEMALALRSAIQFGPFYFDMVTSDPSFDPLRDDVQVLQNQILGLTQATVQQAMDETDEILDVVWTIDSFDCPDSVASLNVYEFQQALKEAEQQFNHATYADILAAGVFVVDTAGAATSQANDIVDQKIAVWKTRRERVNKKARESWLGNFSATGAMIGFVAGCSQLVSGASGFGTLLWSPILYAAIGAAIAYGLATLLNGMSASKVQAQVDELTRLRAHLPY